MLKRVFAPHLGCHVKLGRRQPVAQCPQMRLRDYVMKSLLPPKPGLLGYATNKAVQVILKQILLNDQLGDCVIAMIFHIIGLLTGLNCGKPFIPTRQQVIDLYRLIGGYDPNAPLVNGENPTDQGCDEQTAMNFWQQHGSPPGANRIVGWLAIDANNPTEIAQCIEIFENVEFGVGLPDAYINPFPAGDGFVWDVAGDSVPDNGHAFPGIDRDNQGVVIDTWALSGKFTWRAVAKYANANSGGNLYTALSPESISKASQKCPAGINWAQMIKDFSSLGGTISCPAHLLAP